MPLRHSAVWPSILSHTNAIGTSGPSVMYQRAAGNTAHGVSPTTTSPAISTLTARGRSSAAFVIASHSRMYVVPSNTPETLSTHVAATVAALIVNRLRPVDTIGSSHAVTAGLFEAARWVPMLPRPVQDSCRWIRLPIVSGNVGAVMSSALLAFAMPGPQSI